MKGKESLSLAEATKAALELGWTTTSKDPSNRVGNALYYGKRFTKVAPGRFALKA